ncbi:hypothetical protein [Chitinilyticum aquatile]|uniref:hypothetical protein n=1 Tax=Chitinilyticum aquatile TaxID=362520 RepID=UPI00048B09A8|nr:hypothetical protein [Chitinilyticum aquatile]
MSNPTLQFSPACIKSLSAVEARPEVSNQHEFNGVIPLKRMFGLDGFTREAKFSVRGSNITAAANVTWYDAREQHPTRTEHRLYFQTNAVMQMAQEGDNILIGFDAGNNLHLILIPQGGDGYRGVLETWELA